MNQDQQLNLYICIDINVEQNTVIVRSVASEKEKLSSTDGVVVNMTNNIWLTRQEILDFCYEKGLTYLEAKDICHSLFLTLSQMFDEYLEKHGYATQGKGPADS